jgi:hypothetical protein
MKKIAFFTFVAALQIASTPAAQADLLGLNLGALVGYSSLNANSEFGDGNGSIGYGVRVGFEFFSALAVNGEFIYTSTTPSGTTTGFTSNFTEYVGSLDYDFDLIPRAKIFAGFKMGNINVSSGGNSGSSLGYGGEAGIDFMTGDTFSLGGELTYLAVAAPTVSGNTGNTGSLIQVLVSLKKWL